MPERDGEVLSAPDTPSTRLWIDGDGCPVVPQARRIAARLGVRVTLVTGPAQRALLPSDGFEQTSVTGASEAADDFIALRVGPGEAVVTDDLALANRCLQAGAEVVSSRGFRFTQENIGGRLAQRELGKFLRELGQPSGGPAPFGDESRGRFKMVLHEVLERLKRQEAGGQ